MKRRNLALLLMVSFFFCPTQVVLAESTDHVPRPQGEVTHIPWAFTIYDEPNFAAAKQGRFSAQTVTVLETNGDGWALIETYKGAYWTYLNDNLLFVDRRMGLYDNKGDTHSISMISPQTVKVLEEEESWMQIETWLGPKWINLLWEPDTSDLHEFISRYGTIGVYYQNLNTGYTYRYNADRQYNAASVIKAPYCLYVYHLAEAGQADLSTMHTYNASDFRDGTGVIRHMPIGTTFTESDLLRYAIRNSDNVALAKLVAKYGTEAFKSFVAEIGGTPAFIGTVAGAKMTAEEAGIYAKAIYTYIESDSTYGAQFKEDLLNTTNPMIVADAPVARKYGWWEQSYHDMAIVYADSPYILVIMTPWEGGNSSPFKAISLRIQAFNNLNFS